MKSNRKDIFRIESETEGMRRSIIKVYAEINGELKLIWEAIRSCFGSGFWIKDRPWINDDAWKNE